MLLRPDLRHPERPAKNAVWFEVLLVGRRNDRCYFQGAGKFVFPPFCLSKPFNNKLQESHSCRWRRHPQGCTFPSTGGAQGWGAGEGAGEGAGVGAQGWVVANRTTHPEGCAFCPSREGIFTGVSASMHTECFRSPRTMKI